MRDMNGLPSGGWNLPPGVTDRDIEATNDQLPEEPGDIWARLDDDDKRRIAVEWVKSGRDDVVEWLDMLDPSSHLGQSWREFRDSAAVEQDERDNGRL